MSDCTKFIKFSEFNKVSADRLSELPDALIHLIYSFLDMKEVLGTTLLSKRWRRDLWCSSPTLNFDEKMWRVESESASDSSEHERSVKFVDRVLLSHETSKTVLHKLSLCSYSGYRWKTGEWITSAIKRHVQELHLEDVRIGTSLNGDFKSLSIRNCSFPSGEFTISSSTLKFLMVENGRLGPDLEKEVYVKFKLSAQNLRTLSLKGYTFREYIMDDLSGLVAADIDTPITELYRKSREVTIHMVTEVRNVESLALSAHCLKFLPVLSDGLRQLPLFQNLKHLKLTEWRSGNYSHQREKLVGSFPYLRSLVLERFETFAGPETVARDWGAVLPFDGIFCHLKVIEIWKFDGGENERNFLVFMVNNAEALEHVVMKVTKPVSKEKEEEFVRFSKRLHIMFKASKAPSVTISLRVKKDGRFTMAFEESSNLSENQHPMLDY